MKPIRRRAATLLVALSIALGSAAVITESPASAVVTLKGTLECSPGLGQVRGPQVTNDRVLIQWFWYDYATNGWKTYYDPNGWTYPAGGFTQSYSVWWAAYVWTYDYGVASGPQAVSPYHQSHWATTSSGSFICSAY